MSATPTLTFRVSSDLQQQATAKARHLGIPLTAVLRQALVQFIHQEQFSMSNESGIEIIPVPRSLQKKVDETMDLVHKAVQKRLAGS